MAVSTDTALTCAYCGKPIMPLLEPWCPCEAGPIHEDCWQEYLREIGAAVRRADDKEVA